MQKEKKQIYLAHNPRFNHDLQLKTDCIKWALQKIELIKLPNDRLESVIKTPMVCRNICLKPKLVGKKKCQLFALYYYLPLPPRI